MLFGLPLWAAATLAGSIVAFPLAVRKAKTDALRAYVESYIASTDDADKQAIKTAALQAFAGKLTPQMFDAVVASVKEKRGLTAKPVTIEVKAEPKEEHHGEA